MLQSPGCSLKIPEGKIGAEAHVSKRKIGGRDAQALGTEVPMGTESLAVVIA